MTTLVAPAALALTAACLLLLPRRRPTPAGASVLDAALRRWRRSALIIAAGLPLMGLVALAPALLDPALVGTQRASLAAVGGALVVLGLLIAVRALRRVSALRGALSDRPETITAVEPRPPFIALTVAGAPRLAFSVHPADHCRALDELARRAPHAARRAQ